MTAALQARRIIYFLKRCCGSAAQDPWRDLPANLGNWHTVFIRYNHWLQKGSWKIIFEALSKDADFEYLMVILHFGLISYGLTV